MKKLTFVALFLILAAFKSEGQSQEKAYALLLMNFAKNIQWPEQGVGTAFTIGVMSYPPLLTEMQTIAKSKQIGGRQIVLKEIDAPADATGCEILFIPSFKSKKLPDIVKSVGKSSTLIVTNTFQLNQGSGVNLTLKDGKLVYQISSKSVEARGLKVPASVKNMGTVVD